MVRRRPSVAEALLELTSPPRLFLVQRWHWKAAIFSTLCRAVLFFATNLKSGPRAAMGAMFAELVYRGATAGFYGAVTQQMARARPRRLANFVAIVIVPIIAHVLETAVHLLRGTPNLSGSIFASVAFTVLSTSFNLYAMRRRTFLVGDDSRPLWSDMAAMPRTIFDFVASGPPAMLRCAKWICSRSQAA
jgi:hypothetical protein